MVDDTDKEYWQIVFESVSDVRNNSTNSTEITGGDVISIGAPDDLDELIERVLNQGAENITTLSTTTAGTSITTRIPTVVPSDHDMGGRTTKQPTRNPLSWWANYRN